MDHYIKNLDFKGKDWQQILQEVGNRFDDETFDDPVAELVKLKQESSLIEYLEHFDNLLARVSISERLL